MRRSTATLGLLLIAIAVPGLASAQCADPNTSVFPTHVLVCPLGDIPVTAQVNDAAGNPCAGTTIFMSFYDACRGLLCAAPGYPYPVATAVTNASGQVVFRPQVGGCCLVGSVAFWDSAGTVLATVPTVNSPDITGDCSVNLADVVRFSAAWSGGYQPCADFNMDGIINLVDVTVLSAHFGH